MGCYISELVRVYLRQLSGNLSKIIPQEPNTKLSTASRTRVLNCSWDLAASISVPKIAEYYSIVTVSYENATVGSRIIV